MAIETLKTVAICLLSVSNILLLRKVKGYRSMLEESLKKLDRWRSDAMATEISLLSSQMEASLLKGKVKEYEQTSEEEVQKEA